jgi:hypothetical protein
MDSKARAGVAAGGPARHEAKSKDVLGQLGQELQLVQRARQQLKAKQHEAALTTLRLHAELYPGGAMAPEAQRLRERALRAMAAGP